MTAAKMRSEVDQVNAKIRDDMNAMSKRDQAMLAVYLQEQLRFHNSDKVQCVVYGLAYAMLANVLTDIAEMKEADDV